MERFISHSAAETEAFAARLAGKLSGGEVIAYFGGLGMGKTTFTRGLARGLGWEGEVSSPTFALVHEYRCSPPLYHFDMYRVTSFDDLYSTGFFDYMENGGVLAIEWSENIETALPEDCIRISFDRLGDEEREITVEGLAL
jgi:tRNA threonylcarbamoyladenosine biosynthesis protein TsaE